MNLNLDEAGLLELLHRNDGYSLPFTVRSASSSGDQRHLFAATRAAIDSANEAALSRRPHDPTWCGDATPVGSDVVAEIAKGTLDDNEVMAWFRDFLAAIGDERGQIVPRPADRRVPNVHDWTRLSPSITAYLNFVPSDPTQRLWTTPLDVLDVAEDLVDWSRLPGATVVVDRGLVSIVTPANVAARELRLSAEHEAQFDLWQVTMSPRRARLVGFRSRAKGFLQIVDETASRTDCLPHLLDGLRLLAPYLLQAHVRPGQTTAANELDTSFALSRPLTQEEDWATTSSNAHLLGDHVRGAYVAQVLTTAHLDKIGHPDGFEVEDLGNDRHLVVATKPGPWLTASGPDPDLLDAAREAFGPAMLTAEVVRNARAR